MVARRVVIVDDDAEPAAAQRHVSVDAARALASRPAVFLPADPPRDSRVAFVGEDGGGEVTVAEFVTTTKSGAPRKRPKVVLRSSPALVLPVQTAVPVLAQARKLALDDPSAAADPASVFWGTAAVLALGLVARGRLLPGVSPSGYDAWRIGPFDGEDVQRVRDLAALMPPAARAVPVPGAVEGTVLLPESEPLLRTFLDAVADVLPRTPGAARMVGGGGAFAAAGAESVPQLRSWAGEVAAGIDAGARVSLRLEMPHDSEGGFLAVTQLHSLADPTAVRDVEAAWPSLLTGPDRQAGARTQIEVLLTLRRAARVWPPLARLLATAVPAVLELSDDEVFDLLGDAAPRLSAAGVDVHLPKELARSLTARAVLDTPKRPGSDLRSYFDAGSLLAFRWELALGGQALTAAEMDRIAEAARPLVRLRDQWVVVDEALTRKARQRELAPVGAIDALGIALTGTAEADGQTVPVQLNGWLADLKARIAEPDRGHGEIGQPAALRATLRDYQLRGLDWLDRMTTLGLGGCLADDMGLGKTITLIALHLRRQQDPATARPTLVVCPTSLLGNWEREIERFAPGTPVRRFHGADRDVEAVRDGEFVLTTYGTARIDAERLDGVGWGLLAADEAQHVKNPYSHTAKALRTIGSQARIALTGTPVENNLSELWALLDWTTPGLLGPLRTFRSRYAKAVEADHDPQTTARLAMLVKPFLLRRRKSDPGIAPELPPKTETDHPVALTREQTVLYEAFVREMMDQIAGSSGIDRRGLILKLLTALKQICNHPAQYLKEAPGKTALPGRSGKLELLDELVETIVAEDGAVLVFSQYVAMNRLIERHLNDRGIANQFLHGQTPVRTREDMVRRFQDGEVPVFLLSLKAAGVGLNLTRAGHVIHYDRWWNPAVEEQATDRAYRIGQTQPVQVHRLIAEGTVEDRIATALKEKRDLAEAVLTGGEAAFTELTDAELADLVTLTRGR
ncbi:DEAD/DEAH box helicase [Catenulispora sp. NF23]|uniref:DEAD/DEAH box helicase n=1 Tax=Catenulispora pinistramenti TaxID=2705254 RepID=UPI001BA55862|nr:DEAD/DEAH box helicase [Catenulispora pinistramenti]MBS2531395.1 DEAD/DEAH box helicase [Catenulispora pinistramenti]